MNKLKVNDFFCGAGGMGLGFKYAGYETVGAWDFDKYAVQSYKHNVDEIVEQSDITEMVGSDVPNADVWTFGFPCQDLSVAGKQAGMIKGKTRSGLFFEVMRLLEEVSNKPKVILAENVKGLKPYLQILKDEYDKAGYVMYVKLFNSKYWQVPQNRERYFVTGVRKDLDKGYFKFPKQDESFVPKLSSILEAEVDEKYYIDDEKAKKIIEQAMKRVELEPNVDTTEKLGGIWGNKQAGSCWNKNGVSPTLKTPSGGYSEPLILENYRVRKLTPREYARLQGFPDSFEFICSNTQTYKQMGNAVTVNVAKAIGQAIKEHLEVKL